MDRRALTLLIIVMIAAIAGLSYLYFMRDGEEVPTNLENFGGKYQAIITHWEGHASIEYTDDAGTHSDAYFEIDMRDGLDWIRINTPEDATILCWWDYGHMIKGYAERDVVVRNPSEEILDSVMDPSSITELDPNERISDVATAFATSSSAELLQIAEKYGVTHILVRLVDQAKAGWIYKAAGLEPTNYLVSQDSGYDFNEEGRQTMLARLIVNRDTGVTLIFEDAEIKVYMID